MAEVIMADGSIRRGDPQQPEAWHVIGASGEPAFQNGATWTGTFYEPVRFYKDPLGMVHLHGSMSATSGLVCFTLPVGYRPGYWLEQKMRYWDGTKSMLGVLSPDPSGVVYVYNNVQGGSGAMTYVSLDNHWRAEA